MKKIKISISVNSIYFSFTNKVNEENINQTSYIETGNLLFEYDYLLRNQKIISSFIADITNQTKINTIKIKNMELVPLILMIVKDNTSINKLYILDNKPIDTNSFLTIVDNKNINYLNCFNMSGVMFNYLNDRKDILIDLRSEFTNSSNFIKENKLNKYSTIYYKKQITITEDFSNIDAKDFETFLIINQNLHTINIKKYSFETIHIIYQLLTKYNKKNININIYQKTLNNEELNKIKKLKAKNIKIAYNQNTFLKQTNTFLLILILFGIITIISLFVSK